MANVELLALRKCLYAYNKEIVLGKFVLTLSQINLDTIIFCVKN